MPLATGVAAGVAAGEDVAEGSAVAPVPRKAAQPGTMTSKVDKSAMWKTCGRKRRETRLIGVRIAPRRQWVTLGSSHTLAAEQALPTVRETEMGVVIIRELVGTSPRSWSDAARQAVATASRTVRNIREIEVVKSSAKVENGEIVEYRVELKLHFEYEGS